MFNGDTAYITQLKQQKSKRFYYFAARRHNVNVLLRNSTNIAALHLYYSWIFLKSYFHMYLHFLFSLIIQSLQLCYIVKIIMLGTCTLTYIIAIVTVVS